MWTTRGMCAGEYESWMRIYSDAELHDQRHYILFAAKTDAPLGVTASAETINKQAINIFWFWISFGQSIHSTEWLPGLITTIIVHNARCFFVYGVIIKNRLLFTPTKIFSNRCRNVLRAWIYRERWGYVRNCLNYWKILLIALLTMALCVIVGICASFHKAAMCLAIMGADCVHGIR